MLKLGSQIHRLKTVLLAMKSQLEQDALFATVIESYPPGRSALAVYVSGKKHADAVAKVKNFFKPRTSE